MSEPTSQPNPPGGIEHGSSPRRWAIVLAFMLLCGGGLYNQITLGTMAPEVMKELNLTEIQLPNIMLAPLLASLVLGLIGGNLADRYGAAKVIDISLILMVAGLIWRIFADSFVTGFASMLLIGVGSAVAGANMPKVLGAWFRPSQMGIAVGLFMSAMAAGTGISQATGALWGTPKALFTGCAVITAVFIAFFVVVVRDRPKGAAAPPAPQKSTSVLGETLKNPHVWMIALAMLFFSGWQMVFANYLPNMLRLGHEMGQAEAGSLSSFYAWGGLAGCFIMPALAARLGKMKPVIIAGSVLAGVSVYLAYITAPTAVLVGLFLALAGCGGAAISCLAMTAPALVPSIGPARVGTAGGVVATVQTIGGYALPAFVVVPLAGSNYMFMTILGAVIVLFTVFTMLGLPEFAPPKKAKAPAGGDVSKAA